ncbi:hypothetical protein [Hyphomicrobium sp.]|uniref:hypothetical protein n=1 Tax=Hyphomicrobium sp. TaxID=82 RepID=UPI000FB6E918|nr:hypothetical protein [Hyphomicrobium sp.]RUO99057.1 MAG: electron transfer flavoprotein subunit beta/FixA family protein [Hyphomicrobium sp.]
MGDVPSVAALVSAGRHPLTGVPRACRGDAVAMALGRALAGEKFALFHIGSVDEPSLRDYLAYGADKVEVIPANKGDVDINAVADVVKNFDIVLTGTRAEVAAGSGMFPYMLAHAMACPVVTNALDIRVDQSDTGTNVVISQFLPKGQRRSIASATPLVIAVHPFAAATLKYAHSRRVSGTINVIGSVSAAPARQPSWAVEAAPRRPVRLKAAEKQAGHARLLSAIVSEAKGGVVAFEGTTVDKAQVVLNYLREHRLVDF